MELYTEEQVSKIASQVLRLGYYDASIKPIELPSDEEMVKILDPYSDEFACGYYAAINMIEEQIKQQAYGN
jgi:hypothetical protein